MANASLDFVIKAVIDDVMLQIQFQFKILWKIRSLSFNGVVSVEESDVASVSDSSIWLQSQIVILY